MIHDEVDKWVDQIIDEVFEDGKQPTIMELSQLFSETKQNFFGACFQALIEQKYAGLLDQEYAPCPRCNPFLVYRDPPRSRERAESGDSVMLGQGEILNSGVFRRIETCEGILFQMASWYQNGTKSAFSTKRVIANMA